MQVSLQSQIVKECGKIQHPICQSQQPDSTKRPILAYCIPLSQLIFFKGLSELPVLIFCKLVYNRL